MKPINLFLLASVTAVFVWSGVAPKDRFTWFLEVAPALIGAALLAATRRRLPLSQLLYGLLWAHALVLIVGGKYTYAENPLFEWIKTQFELDRNYYDRLGHFFQGFVPAIACREVLARTSPLRPGKWLSFVCVCIPLAFSAFYELVEWWVAIGTGEAAEAFLGTQGDVWDTQWDMCMCLIGAATSLALLSRLHDRSMAVVAMPPRKDPLT